MITSSQFTQHYLPKMEKIITSNVDKQIKAGDWKTFFAEGTTKTKYSDTRIQEATGPMRAITEGALVPKIGLNDGHTKRRYVNHYGFRVEWTKFVRMFADPKLIARIAKIGSDSPNQLLSEIAMSYIELGDQSQANVPLLNGKPMIDVTAADGQPIFSTAHTFKSSALQTYSNKASTYLSLTSDTLFDMVNQVEQWRNNVNQLMDFRAKKLIVGYTNRKKAIELLKSPDDSETTNRSINALKELSLTFDVYRRMATPSEWFLETTAENDFTFDFAWKTQTEKGYDQRSLIHFVVGDMAVQHGIADPTRFLGVKAA